MTGLEHEGAKLAFLLAKDGYYVSRWVIRSFKSAKHSNAEEEALRRRIYAQMGRINGFSNTYLRELPRDLAHYDEYNKSDLNYWLDDVTIIYEDFRSLWAKHCTVLAQTDDTDYQSFLSQYAKWQRDPTFEIANMEPMWLLEGPDQPGATAAITETVTGLGAAAPETASSSKHSLKESLKFGFWNKRKLESVLKSLEGISNELATREHAVQRHHPRFQLQKKLEQGQYEQVAQLLQEVSEFQGQLGRQSIGMPSHLAIVGVAQEEDGVIPTKETKVREAFRKLRVKPNDLSGYTIEPPEATGLVTGSIEKDGEREWVLVEYKKWPKSDDDKGIRESKEQIMRLIEVLASANQPTFPTLALRGFAEQHEHQRYALVFSYPDDSERGKLLTLLELISKPENDRYKSARFPQTRHHVAWAASQCIAAFHTDGWVHQSVRSESVVFFMDPSSKPNLRKPYFVRFEHARPTLADTQGASANITPELRMRRFYQHPNRLKEKPENFIREYDLYSLGVVLLELALWKTAEEIHNLNCKIRQEEGRTLLPTGVEMRKVFQTVARDHLPLLMGPSYTDAVRACLSEEYAEEVLKTSNAIETINKIVDLVHVARREEW
jgi:serine/threonine protein kinase